MVLRDFIAFYSFYNLSIRSIVLVIFYIFGFVALPSLEGVSGYCGCLKGFRTGSPHIELATGGRRGADGAVPAWGSVTIGHVPRDG